MHERGTQKDFVHSTPPKIIEEAAKLFDHPLKQYMLFHEFEQQVQARPAQGAQRNHHQLPMREIG